MTVSEARKIMHDFKRLKRNINRAAKINQYILYLLVLQYAIHIGMLIAKYFIH